MKVKISKLKKVLIASLVHRGLSKTNAEIVAEPLLEAELLGKKTHGINKILVLDNAIKNRKGKPKVIKDKFNYAMIDANKELGFISANFATDLLIKKARKYGNACVAVVNSYYYGIVGVYARKIADAGFVGIILNNGGPAAVTPYGGSGAVFGTNPIAIGIPTDKEPIVLDMATSEKTWGEINLAKVENRKLQKNTFFDAKGKLTTDPNKAVAIMPFGGAKGYGLNFMFEILTGAFVGAKMGLQTKSGYDLGFLFLALSPEMFTTRKELNRKINKLIKEVKGSRKLSSKEVTLPGEQSMKREKQLLKKGYIEIPKETWNTLLNFSKGMDIKNRLNLKE